MNKNNPHKYKNLSNSELNRELTKVAVDVYGTTVDGLVELYANNAGSEPREIWNIFCDSYPAMRTPTYGDDVKIIEILREIHKRKKAPKKTLLRDQQISDTAEIMEVLKQRYRFITAEDTKTIYYFLDGVYEEAATLIETEVEAHFGDTNSSYFTSEVINHLRRNKYTKRDKFNADKTRIPLKNGLFNLDTFKLEPFDEDKIFTFRIPIMYDADAESKNIVAWIEEITSPDSLDLLQEYTGYSFEPRLPLHKTLWMHGYGRNGKGAYVRLLTKAIGSRNRSSVPLEQLTAKFRFALIRLFDKLVNISSEPQSNYVFQTETFKNITGGDEVEGEIKGLTKTVHFTPFAKMFIMGNKYPNINDDTTGFWERMEIVSFPNDYSENFIADIEDKKIIEDGGEEQALAGFFNWCMVGLKRLKDHDYRLTKSKSSEEIRLEFEKVSNSVRAFITECVSLKASEKYTQPALWSEYQNYCDQFDLEIQQKSLFTKRIGELRGVRLGSGHIGGKKQRVWFGLIFKGYEKEGSVEDCEEEGGGQTGQKGQTHIPSRVKNNKEKKNIIEEEIANLSLLSPLSHPKETQKCVCGKLFDTMEVLHQHQANCPEFQANQDKEAKSPTSQTPHSKNDTATDEEEDGDEKDREEITKAVGKITEGDPDFLERHDSDTIMDACLIVQSVLGEEDIEIEDSTIANILEEMMSQNQKINGGKTNE